MLHLSLCSFCLLLLIYVIICIIVRRWIKMYIPRMAGSVTHNYVLWLAISRRVQKANDATKRRITSVIPTSWWTSASNVRLPCVNIVNVRDALAPQLSPGDRANKDQISHTRRHGRRHRRRCQAARRTAANFVRPTCWLGRRIKRPRLTWRSVRSSPTIRWTVASFRGAARRRLSPTPTVGVIHCR